MSLTSLPFEILENILTKTDGITLLNLRVTSKHLKTFIDENQMLWKAICDKEVKFASRIAKRKCRDELTWFEIYRNIKKWSLNPDCEYSMRKFYHFAMHDKCHTLDIDNNILPLRESKGIILYDMKTMKYMPVVIPEKNCLKMTHNDFASVVQFKNCILLQRNAEKVNNTEGYFKADNYVLSETDLYFFNNRDVFKCDLKSTNLALELLYHSDYDLSEIQFCDSILYLFTDCGKIISINSAKHININPINVPEEWLKRIKHFILFDDKNYVGYSRNLFKIKVEDTEHLYLEFATVTAVFFYGDIILVGTKAGEILLYRISSQKQAKKAVFEKLAILPSDQFAVALDLYERKRGPLIVAATWFDIFVVEVNLFSEEQNQPTKKINPMGKLNLYKRLMKLKGRVQNMKF